MNTVKKYLIFILFFSSISFLFNNLYADDYPSTSIAIIDINELLNSSKVAINVNEQIAEISEKIQERLAADEENLLDEQKKLIEAQGIMAPEAFEEKRIEYEKEVQNFQIESQNLLVSLDNKVATIRAQILDEIKPILEQVADEKGITVILQKETVILNADNMDITKIVMKQLNKNLPKIEVEFAE
tara:strand:- start:1066 stop:1623 length:558 start_codon:yes stop_codon:yes gene_type:complete